MRLHQLVIEPAETRLARRGAAKEIWADAQSTVSSLIYATHLERLVREWALLDAGTELLSGRPTICGPSVVGPSKQRIQLDVVAVETTPRGGRRVCTIGEVKSGRQPVGLAELDRLDAAVGFLPEQTSSPKRLLVARGGFTRELSARAGRRTDVELVDLPRLYAPT